MNSPQSSVESSISIKAKEDQQVVVMTEKQKIWLYLGFSLLAFSLSLDQYTAGAYLAEATATAFSAHSALAAITTIKAVFQSVSQPPIAKIADVFGRLQAYTFCLFLYAIGYILASSASNVYAYAVGISVNVIGITGLFLLQEIIIADISSLRNRLFWSIFPSIPGLINGWISGNVTESILTNSSWRWGVGMFAILSPVLTIPIIMTLTTIKKRSKPPLSTLVRGKEAFWQLDPIGLVLLVAGAGLVLTPVTLGSIEGAWTTQYIVMVVFGAVSSIAFVIFEIYFAKHPLLPFQLLKNRSIIAGFVIAIAHPMAGGAALDYFYTFLVVAANQSTLSATRITGLTSFTSIITAVLAGILVSKYLKKLKLIILIGTALDIVGLGLMIKFRSASNTQGELAVSQVIRGIAEGLIGFPVQASVQAMSKPEHVAAVTSVYLALYHLSGGVGAAIGGGIWTNVIQGKLDTYIPNNITAAQFAFEDPFNFILEYDGSSLEKLGLDRAYNETQTLICSVAAGIAGISLIAALFLHDPVLTDERSLKNAEQGGKVEIGDVESVEVKL